MAEAPRPRPVEYYNPRPLILAICFFWGIAMGFCIFYFAPPKQMTGENTPKPVEDTSTVVPQRGDRWKDVPRVTEIDLTAAPTTQAAPAFTTSVLEPLIPALTTEGGLTGRTARPVARQSGGTLTAPESVRPAVPMNVPPPLPDLRP